MKTVSFIFLTKEGFRNVLANKLMSIASISVLFSCLVMIGSAALLTTNTNSIIGSVEDKNIITVFYKQNIDGMLGDRLGIQIKSIENVKSLEFVSKEDGYRIAFDNADPVYKEYLSGGEDALPDSYNVTVKNMVDYGATIEDIENLEDVDSVRGSSSLADIMRTLRGALTTISSGIIGMMLLVALIIISNTIKVTMFSRRLEIDIMKSVGATSWFIRWPFMIEGMILGVIAGIFATLAVWGIYEAAIRVIAQVLTVFGGRSSLPFTHYALLILLSFTGIGIVTGGFGSIISITKYLREKEFVNYEN